MIVIDDADHFSDYYGAGAALGVFSFHGHFLLLVSELRSFKLALGELWCMYFCAWRERGWLEDHAFYSYLGIYTSRHLPQGREI